MECAVHLLPEFQIGAVEEFVSAPKGTQHLLALTEPNEENPSGIILYRVHNGRQNTTTLLCRLLLVSVRTKTDVALALIRHVIGEQKPHRVEAEVTNHDPNADL